MGNLGYFHSRLVDLIIIWSSLFPISVLTFRFLTSHDRYLKLKLFLQWYFATLYVWYYIHLQHINSLKIVFHMKNWCYFNFLAMIMKLTKSMWPSQAFHLYLAQTKIPGNGTTNKNCLYYELLKYFYIVSSIFDLEKRLKWGLWMAKWMTGFQFWRILFILKAFWHEG